MATITINVSTISSYDGEYSTTLGGAPATSVQPAELLAKRCYVYVYDSTGSTEVTNAIATSNDGSFSISVSLTVGVTYKVIAVADNNNPCITYNGIESIALTQDTYQSNPNVQIWRGEMSATATSGEAINITASLRTATVVCKGTNDNRFDFVGTAYTPSEYNGKTDRATDSITGFRCISPSQVGIIVGGKKQQYPYSILILDNDGDIIRQYEQTSLEYQAGYVTKIYFKSTAAYKFAHYYRNDKLVGTGSYKFRRYSTINYKLRAPVLSLSGDKLSIVAVDSKDEYAKDFKLSAVKTSGGTTTNVIVAKTVDTYNLPGDLIADDATGSYYITAVLEANEPYVDSDESNKLTYTLKERLATPTNVTSSMTTITWNAVANAGSYKVYMDNVLYQDNAGTANEVNYVFNDTLSSDTNSDSTAFTCGGKSYAKMIYTYASSSSNALLYYDSNNVATTVYSNGSWVNSTYKILKFATKPSGRWFATNGTFATSTYSYDISTNSLWENAIDGVHSFTIVATGNSSYRDSLQSDAVLITKSSQTQLATPANVSIDGTTLSWDEVENATSYDIYADGTLIGNTTGEAGETWVLNEILSDDDSNTLQKTEIAFESNGEQFSYLVALFNGALSAVRRLYYDSTWVYDPAIDDHWSNTAYRTITFETAPTGDLLTWLQANGTKQ